MKWYREKVIAIANAAGIGLSDKELVQQKRVFNEDDSIRETIYIAGFRSWKKDGSRLFRWCSNFDLEKNIMCRLHIMNCFII